MVNISLLLLYVMLYKILNREPSIIQHSFYLTYLIGFEVSIYFLLNPIKFKALLLFIILDSIILTDFLLKNNLFSIITYFLIAIIFICLFTIILKITKELELLEKAKSYYFSFLSMAAIVLFGIATKGIDLYYLIPFSISMVIVIYVYIKLYDYKILKKKIYAYLLMLLPIPFLASYYTVKVTEYTDVSYMFSVDLVPLLFLIILLAGSITPLRFMMLELKKDPRLIEKGII